MFMLKTRLTGTIANGFSSCSTMVTFDCNISNSISIVSFMVTTSGWPCPMSHWTILPWEHVSKILVLILSKLSHHDIVSAKFSSWFPLNNPTLTACQPNSCPDCGDKFFGYDVEKEDSNGCKTCLQLPEVDITFQRRFTVDNTDFDRPFQARFALHAFYCDLLKS